MLRLNAIPKKSIILVATSLVAGFLIGQPFTASGLQHIVWSTYDQCITKHAQGNRLDVSLNKTACDHVNSNSDQAGCYDTCLALVEKDQNVTEHGFLALSQDYPHELINACAVVLNGGDY